MFEIGESLREARVRKGLGYPEVELATKIRAKYIRAIEEEEFAALPADAYIRGFLRAYADHLGLDGQLYVDEYVSRFAPGLADELPARRARPRNRSLGVERRAVVFALLGIGTLAALVIVAWKFGGAGSSTPPGLASHNARTGATAKLLTLRGVGKGSYVVIRRRSATGPLLLQGTVGPGSREAFAGSRFFVFARTPAGLRLRLGGKAVPLPSARNLRVLVTPRKTTRIRG